MDNNICNMPPIEETWNDDETTRAGSSPSEASHSSSISREKPLSSNFSSKGRRSGSVLSKEALNTRGIDAPPTEGWPCLAQKMVENVDFESFCRFRELNVKNLLYYQVEIAEMEAELKKVEREDSVKERQYATFPANMLKSKDRPNLSLEERKQCNLVLKIRKSLKEYNKAILRHAQISAMPQPNANNVNNLCQWIWRGGCGEDGIGGEDASVWGKINNKEQTGYNHFHRILHTLRQFRLRSPKEDKNVHKNLVQTHPCQRLDTFTRWVGQDVVPFWHDICNSRAVGLEHPRFNDPANYPYAKILKFTSLVATVVACVLPTVAIDILSTAKTKRDKLLYIGGFTMLFAIGLLLFTEAGTLRIHVFMATATFSAVLVVFIQNG